MVTLGLIRHARTRWNQERKIQGRTDIELSSQGRDQAGRWAVMLVPERYDVIFASPMVRAQQTAQILSNRMGVDIEYDADLREQDFGDWEGKTLVQVSRHSPEKIEQQESRGWEFCPPNGESRIRVLKRVLRSMETAAARFDKKQVLVVSHSSVMKIMIYHALGRAFMPDEPPLLRPYHLHVMTWQTQLQVGHLNAINLNSFD